MRDRERVLQSLERVYRDAFGAAERSGDAATMARLDLEFQRDQVHLEVLLDIRELLLPAEPLQAEKTTSLLEKAQQIRNLARLRP
jgi:hypothetical protein